MSGLRQWLAAQQLEGYFESLDAERVDLDVLADLTEADLVQLGMPLGDRKRMLRGIETLRRRPAAQGASARSSAGAAPRAAGPVVYGREELRQLTLLFADLVGSTQIATTLDLESYRDAISSYQLCCSGEVHDNHGYVAQFLGDGVVAYFGYPAAEEDDAERAVSAGLGIAREVPRLELAGAREMRLAARIGIATGEVLVSDLVGDRLSIEGAVVGGVPNLAARLQSMAEPGQVVISGNTRRLLGRQFDCVRLGERSIKGFDELQEIWLVRGLEAGSSRFASHARGPLSPLVGRLDELQILRNRWDSASAGEGQVVLISGEAGIGKSRLGESLSETIAGQPHRRISFQCSPYHNGSPFYPIITEIARAARFAEGDSDEQRLDKLERLLALGGGEVGAVAPLVARLLSIPCEHRYGAISDPPEVIKERTAEALIGQLFEMAAREPLLVFVEDLHWVDPSTQELLDRFIERIGKRPVLLLFTYRPQYEAPWIGRARVTQLALSRLDRERSLALVSAIDAESTLPRELVDQIVDKTDGVPLFIEELTRAVLARVGTVDNGSDDGMSLPSSLKELLMAKLDSLSSAREVVPVCAAIGRSFSYRVLLAVTQLGEEALGPILDQLKAAQILFESGVHPDVSFTFRHALIQEAAYETMLASRARALHARIAHVLATQFTDVAETRPEVVAQHLGLAGHAAEARERWRAAAALAIARSANVEACAHLRHALAENASLGQDAAVLAEEISLREMLREPIELCGWGSEEIERNLRRLYELREHQGDRDALFSVVYGSCGTQLLAGRLAEAEIHVARMAELAAETGDPAQDILTVHTRALIDFLAGRFDDAIKGFDREITAFGPEHAAAIRQHYVADPAIVARVMQAWALALAGEAERSEARIAEAEPLIEAQAQSFSRIYGLTIIASIRQTRGQAAEALAVATKAWEMSRRERVPYWEAWAAVVHGWALVATGEAAPGLKTLRAGLADYARTGAGQMLPYGRTLLADACLRAGRIQEGLAVVEELEQKNGSNQIRFFEAERTRIAIALRAAADKAAGP